MDIEVIQYKKIMRRQRFNLFVMVHPYEFEDFFLRKGKQKNFLENSYLEEVHQLRLLLGKLKNRCPFLESTIDKYLTNYFLILPKDLLLHIVSFLNSRDKMAFLLSCKTLYQLNSAMNENSDGDSKHDPFVTKELLDLELEEISNAIREFHNHQ